MAEDRPAPLIGEFSGPQENSPRLPRKDEPDKAEIEEKKEELSTQEGSPPTAQETAQTYEETLEEAGIDLGKAREIMDSVMSEGYYEESHNLGKKEITIRTRSYADTLRAQNFLEVENPTYNFAINELIARYNTAASLVKCGDKMFDIPTDESTDKEVEALFQERYKFLLKQPGPFVNRLMNLVHQFDLRVAAAFSDGAPEDF